MGACMSVCVCLGKGQGSSSFTKLESRTHLPTQTWACLLGCCSSSSRRRWRQQQTEVHIPHTKPVSQPTTTTRCGERRWGNDKKAPSNNNSNRWWRWRRRLINPPVGKESNKPIWRSSSTLFIGNDQTLPSPSRTYTCRQASTQIHTHSCIDMCVCVCSHIKIYLISFALSHKHTHSRAETSSFSGKRVHNNKWAKKFT